MRFRITRKSDGSCYSIIVTGEMNDDGAWDVLQIAQTMLGIRRCTELVLDLRAAFFDEELSVLNTDILTSVFEEGLLMKDCSVVLLFDQDQEIRLCSDQLPLEENSQHFTSITLGEAKFYGRAMRWVGQEAKLLEH